MNGRDGSTDPEGDSCFSIVKIMEYKGTLFSKKQYNVNFFQFLAGPLPVVLTWHQNQLIDLDIASYGSKSEHAKTDIGCFGKYYIKLLALNWLQPIKYKTTVQGRVVQNTVHIFLGKNLLITNL